MRARLLFAAILTACGSSPATPPPDGSVPDAGDPFEGCEGVALTADGVLDVDLAPRTTGGPGPTGAAPIRITGRVTLESAPFPAMGRGRLRFSGPASSTVELSSAGDATYSVDLLPGTYEVSYRAGDCVPGGGPCNGGPLTTVELRTDGVLDVDVPVVDLAGAVTLRSGPFPEGEARGSITFASDDSSHSVAIEPSGPGRYATRLMPGTYDVGFEGAGPCDTETTIPCNGGALRSSIAITDDGVLDVDVRSVTVTGAVRIAGAPLPDAAGARGAVCFAGADGERCTDDLAPSGPATYRAVLVPGAYAMRYRGNASLCGDGPAPAVPCVDGPSRDVTLTTDGVLDVELSPVRISGRVTLNGAPLPDGPGQLVFSTGDDASVTVPLDPDGARYEVTLTPGDYAVRHVATGACGGAEGARLPCGADLGTHALGASGVLDLDVRSVQISGAVTVNGAPMAAGVARGALTFTPVREGESEPGTAALREAGPAGYAIALTPGTYDVRYAPAGDCARAATDPVVPCTGGRIAEGVALSGDGVLDLDLRAVRISGRVTLGGARLPDAPVERGALEFVALDGAGEARTGALGPAGEATWVVDLLAGRYVVRWAPDPALCGVETTEIPCLAYDALGCDEGSDR